MIQDNLAVYRDQKRKKSKRKQLMTMTGGSLGKKEEGDRYLSPLKNYNLTGFDNDAKIRFLDSYEKTGSITGSMKAVGFHSRVFYLHMGRDKQFREDFDLVQRAMKHELEGVMFNRGKKDNGFIDRIAWLRKNYPEEYAPRQGQEQKKDSNKLSDLLNVMDIEQSIGDIREKEE